MPAPDLRGLHVLAVDDNSRSLNILRSYLESFTFKVDVAVNGAEAVNAVENAAQPYDLVILDWKMPVLNGIDAARKIRSMNNLRKVPKLLLISSFGQSETRRHLDENLVDGLTSKPFRQSGLFNAIMQLFAADAGSNVNRLHITSDTETITMVSGAHLLLVEDNEVNQQVARELLERVGVSVMVAENGAEALAMLQEEEFDGVLMDMQMPVMDGITATLEIRKQERFQTLPIIAMTANAMIRDQEKCLAAGMNDYIAKPIEPDKMLVTLAKWIAPAHPARAPEVNTRQLAGLASLPELNGVKVQEGIRRMGGSLATYYIVLEKFRNNQAQVMTELLDSLSAGDGAMAELLAHTLKGVAGTLGAEGIQQQAGELEAAIRDGQPAAEIELLLPPLGEVLSALFANIDHALESHRKSAVIDAVPGEPDAAQIADLLEQLAGQLQVFDSQSNDTMSNIKQQVKGTSGWPRFARLDQYLNAYDYESAQAEIKNIQKVNI